MPFVAGHKVGVFTATIKVCCLRPPVCSLSQHNLAQHYSSFHHHIPETGHDRVLFPAPGIPPVILCTSCAPTPRRSSCIGARFGRRLVVGNSCSSSSLSSDSTSSPSRANWDGSFRIEWMGLPRRSRLNSGVGSDGGDVAAGEGRWDT